MGLGLPGFDAFWRALGRKDAAIILGVSIVIVFMFAVLSGLVWKVFVDESVAD